MTRAYNDPAAGCQPDTHLIDNKSTAGAFQFEPDWGVTPAWQVYFEATSFDAAAAMACRIGGSQGFWRDAPNAGRIGSITDPAGAMFQIAQLLPHVVGG